MAVSIQLPATEGPSAYLACPYFTSAATRLQGNGITCQGPPNGEQTYQDGPNIIEFEDPPGVEGLTGPSGGLFPANGVVVWIPSSTYAAEALCTLPESDHETCTAILNDFIDRYGLPSG
jgi:hypothetical protein